MKIILIVVTVIFGILLIPAILSFGVRFQPNDFQPPNNGTQKIYENFIIEQDFKSSSDNLIGIGTSIKNPFYINKKDLLVTLSENGNIIRGIKLNGQNISDGNYQRILFDPIVNSKNITYKIQLSSPDSINQDALEIFLTDSKPKWAGDLQINKQARPDSVSFNLLYISPNKFSQIINIYSSLGQKIFRDIPFGIIYSLIMIALGALIILALFRKK